MPNYDYLCDQCGPFTERVPMAECDASQPCPVCGTEAPRALLRAPNMAGTEGGQQVHFHSGACGCGHSHH
jgi:putative FmdB family regulatory protein